MGRAVEVGRIGRVHGVRGDLYVERFGDGEGMLDPGRTLRAVQAGRGLDLTVEFSKLGPKGRWIVHFKGIHDREAARALTGSVLTVDECELPPLPDGRHYWFELLGLRVETPEGELLGTIEDIFETGANDIYVVRGERGEVLIPSTDDVVAEVDTDAGRMLVTPIPGLIPDDE